MLILIILILVLIVIVLMMPLLSLILMSLTLLLLLIITNSEWRREAPLMQTLLIIGPVQAALKGWVQMRRPWRGACSLLVCQEQSGRCPLPSSGSGDTEPQDWATSSSSRSCVMLSSFECAFVGAAVQATT